MPPWSVETYELSNEAANEQLDLNAQHSRENELTIAIMCRGVFADRK